MVRSDSKKVKWCQFILFTSFPNSCLGTSPRSQTPVWELAAAKLCFAKQSFAKVRSQTEFGNEVKNANDLASVEPSGRRGREPALARHHFHVGLIPARRDSPALCRW